MEIFNGEYKYSNVSCMFTSKIELFIKSIGLKYFKYNVEGFDAIEIHPIEEDRYLVIACIPEYPFDISEVFDRVIVNNFDGVDTYLFRENNTSEVVRKSTWDDGYMFCICTQCNYVGITFNGRSDRLTCKRKKHNPCKTSDHGDKGYTYAHPFLINAYKKAGIECP